MAVPTKDILAAIERTDPSVSRSSLARWMRMNHDALAARLGPGPHDWKALAQIFSDAGLTNRSGEPASPGAARKAWERAKKAVQAHREKHADAGPTKPSPPANTAPVPTQKPTASPETSPFGPLPEKSRFKFVPSTPVQPKKPEGEE